MDSRRPPRRPHREALAVVRGATPTHAHLRRRLAVIFTATALMSALSTLIVFLTERGAAGTEIHDLFDAFIYSTSQLLTAASVATPRTDFGKVLQLVFDLWAITVVATLAGSFGAFFHQRSKEVDLWEKRLCAEAREVRDHL